MSPSPHYTRLRVIEFKIISKACDKNCSCARVCVCVCVCVRVDARARVARVCVCVSTANEYTGVYCTVYARVGHPETTLSPPDTVGLTKSSRHDTSTYVKARLAVSVGNFLAHRKSVGPRVLVTKACLDCFSSPRASCLIKSQLLSPCCQGMRTTIKKRGGAGRVN